MKSSVHLSISYFLRKKYNMANEFHPISMEQLTSWIFQELEKNNSIFGIPRSLFFTPKATDRFAISKYNQYLITPIGVAAGPHSQMAQNIIVAWLCGARFIELKTVQTMDELQIVRPCIDAEDEGYNVEWSQELKISESYEEYMRAWVLIHALHHKLGFPGETPGVIFNLSVGYNLEGLQKPNMQWYLQKMTGKSNVEKREYVRIVSQYYPDIQEIEIPDAMVSTVTLSTMHGCPPHEIEKIATYLMQEWHLHTSVKLNPTLLGPQQIRQILNHDLGFTDVEVMDSTFDHDLRYSDAIHIIQRLQQTAQQLGVIFGLKLTNTLEVRNFRTVFDPKEKMMYMSGRALHPISIHVGLKLMEDFGGDLLLSFSAGVDAFNVADLMTCGMKTVTVCSDILKSGGYLRMRQYLENLQSAISACQAENIHEYTVKTAAKQSSFAEQLLALLQKNPQQQNSWWTTTEQCQNFVPYFIAQLPQQGLSGTLSTWAKDHHLSLANLQSNIQYITNLCSLINLRQYAPSTLTNRMYHKHTFLTGKSKTKRKLGLFDCIVAPCTEECPVNQKVPQYMAALRDGRFQEAIDIIRMDSALPTILGCVCDHLCEHTCVRTYLDEPLAIRAVKRFIMSQEKPVSSSMPSATSPHPETTAQAASQPAQTTASASSVSAPDQAAPKHRAPALASPVKVAIVGGGPGGITAAYFLAKAGYQVTILEARGYLGGMVAGTIPQYRLPEAAIFQDLKALETLGVNILYHQQVGKHFTLEDLQKQGFQHIIITIGAQKAKKMEIPGEDSQGCLDALNFLRSVREGHPLPLGQRVGIIGAGDTAMDCARTAWRLLKSGQVILIYRRTISEMPADREEIEALQQEGIQIMELTAPLEVIHQDGKMTALRCIQMRLGNRDRSGRRKPEPIPGSEFNLPLDTVISAISQNSDAEFLAKAPAKFNAKGYLEVNPETMETSIPNVYAGGDISQDGPASIVKACGDARKIVASIRRKQENLTTQEIPTEEISVAQALRNRSQRQFRVTLPTRPAPQRKDFGEVALNLTLEQAQKEASRCLECQKMCSICVSVCPNMALHTYRTMPFTMHLPELEIVNGEIRWGVKQTWSVDQPFQIVVFADFCNQCGNCVSFCPTSGQPYQDKPRFFLHKPDFIIQENNAFMLFKDEEARIIHGRFHNELHELLLDGELVYRTPKLEMHLNSQNLEIQDMCLLANLPDGKISLASCATLLALLQGLGTSMPYLPSAR